MKKILYLLTVVFTTFIVFSCEDQADDFFTGKADSSVGGEAGTIVVPVAFTYEYGATPEVSLPIEVSGTIDSYTVYVQLKTASGNSDVEVFGSGSSSETFAYTNDELFNLLTINGNVYNDDSLQLGDVFAFTFEVTLPGNSEPSSLESKNFNAPFACPLNDDFTGEYLIEDVTGSGLVGSVFGEGTIVEVTEASNFGRQFEAIYGKDLAIGNGALAFGFDLLCGQVILDGEYASGLGCTGSIVFGPGETNGVFDSDDDSSFTLTFSENIEEDCGAGVLQTTVRFVKQE
jgi:hypothetical protein